MEFNNREPIYLQIMDDFKMKYINGTYSSGQSVPSRRTLAKQLGVNPNTVQKAYKEMEEIKLIKTLRGRGSFITDDLRIASMIKEEMIDNVVHHFIESMNLLGLSEEELMTQLKKQLHPKLHRNEGDTIDPI